jgi:hypothetical protein
VPEARHSEVTPGSPSSGWHTGNSETYWRSETMVQPGTGTATVEDRMINGPDL